MKGKPMLQPGALPKNAFKQVIDEHLVISKEQDTVEEKSAG
jgi:hypothetical protein